MTKQEKRESEVKLQKQRKAEGVCIKCGQNPIDILRSTVRCTVCLDLQIENLKSDEKRYRVKLGQVRLLKEKYKKQGLCITCKCPKEPERATVWNCYTCFQFVKEWNIIKALLRTHSSGEDYILEKRVALLELKLKYAPRYAVRRSLLQGAQQA